MAAAAATVVRHGERVLDALGDPTRRAILRRVARKPAAVSELAAVLGVTTSAVGQHLVVLERCQLVATRKVGRVRLCDVDPRGLDAIAGWAAFHRAAWSARLDRLGEVLDGLDDA